LSKLGLPHFSRIGCVPFRGIGKTHLTLTLLEQYDQMDSGGEFLCGFRTPLC
jgi:hypothetical protein